MASILDTDNDSYKRNLIVIGVTPTDFTGDDGKNYNYTNVLCMEKLKGDNAHGQGVAVYQYGTSHSVIEFTNLVLPVLVEATCVTTADRKGKNQTIITELELSKAKELTINERKPTPTAQNKS